MDFARRRLACLPAAILLFPLMAAAQADKRVIIIIGPPGSGKTTQAQRLKSKYAIPIVSMSDILKKEGGGKTALNKALKVQIAAGELVNDEMANDLVRKRIAKKDAARGFILDGYPATAGQANYLEKSLAELGLPAPHVVSLDVPDSVAMQRMASRGRADDDAGLAQNRLTQYRSEERLITERYGKSITRVDGTKSPDEVWAAIEQKLP